MRANVLIERSVGLAALGGKAIGSGVILQIEEGEALIVTNRHVVDDDFPSSDDDVERRRPPLAARRNEGQHARASRRAKAESSGWPPARSTWPWFAPVSAGRVRRRRRPGSKGRPMKVGASVFAIGNPHHLGWSHTQGVISQLRTQDIRVAAVRVIQTQAAINPGNSGGGLYDQEGYLLGINTWTADKSVSEGIGFAIALDTLLELAPAARARPLRKLELIDDNAPTSEETQSDHEHGSAAAASG